MTTKVYAVSHGSELAGAELSLVEICRSLVLHGAEVTVSLPSAGPIEDRFVDVGCRVIHVPTHRWMGKRFNALIGSVRLCQALFDSVWHLIAVRRTRPSVVLVNTIVCPSGMLAARIAGTRSILFVRESLNSNPSLRCVLPMRVVRFLCVAMCDRLVVNSEYVNRQFGGGGIVIPPPLNPRFQSETLVSDRADDVMQNCETPGVDRPFEICMVGSIGGDKGQEDFIEALQILARSGCTNIHSTICGTGSDAEVDVLKGLILQASANGCHVDFLGSVVDTKAIYSSSDVTVVCSRNEAFGKVSVESLATGTPVVGYALGGTREILEHGGGVLVNPCTPQALARAIRGLYDKPNSLESMSAEASENRYIGLTLSSANDAAQVVLDRKL